MGGAAAAAAEPAGPGAVLGGEPDRQGRAGPVARGDGARTAGASADSLCGPRRHCPADGEAVR